MALRIASITGSMILSNQSVFVRSVLPYVVIVVLYVASRRVLHFTFAVWAVSLDKTALTE